MCGIAGIFNGGSPEALSRMSAVMVHRGPDDAGLHWFAGTQCGLAHRRLSIIDLSAAGHQPMCNGTGDVWIVFNGEIFNYKEIRDELVRCGVRFRSRSDTEVLLYAYQEWGELCLHRLNGMFAFAIFDQRQRKLFAARDRFGIKPLYYNFQAGRLVFSSEIKAILASDLVQNRPDLYALHTPARFQVSPYTGFLEILKLPPANYLVLQDGELAIRQYWAIQASEQAENESELRDRLDALLNDSVRLQMIADVPVGIFLSGGLDSSVVAALMRRNTHQNVHAFTIKFSDADQKFEKMPPDDIYARQVAKLLGFTHHEFTIRPQIVDLLPKLVWHLDEPLSDPAAINTYLISKAARDLGIVVLLNGMGGDEIFGGYRKQLACLTAETFQTIVPGVLQRLIQRGADMIPVATAKTGFRHVRWAKRFLSFASAPRIERYLMSDLSVAPDHFARLFADGISYHDTYFYKSQAGRFKSSLLSYVTLMCLNDTMVFLPEHNLTYSDKATMAASVEGRQPLTDHRIVDFMFSVLPRERIRRTTQKYLLKKVAERYLPRSVVYRPKAPFASPLRSWIRGPLRDMVDDLLSEDVVRSRGLYDPKYISNLIVRDREGREDNSYLIWTFLSNEIWFRSFFPRLPESHTASSVPAWQDRLGGC
jgi:asparagine synthase (glutamine-hydrolysing)